MVKNLKLNSNKKPFPKWGIFNMVIFFGVIFIFIILYLINTTLIMDKLVDREKSNYEIYFYEDFEGYSQNSEIFDSGVEDLSRWKDQGVITAWTDISNRDEINRIDLKLIDSSGKDVTLYGVENLKFPLEDNRIKSNDAFLDYDFNCDQNLTKWEDYMLIDGRNFLFWEYKDLKNVNMSEITSWRASDGSNEVEIYDIVIHDGLCKNRNSLNGNWYSPNGLPQYGVWWTDNGNLIMRNIEQEQYPSNGDHVRILSTKDTPEDFLLKVRLKVTNLGKESFIESLNSKKNHLDNTYVRIAWDFDDEYDPGHDQTLIYNSFEYGYLGLQRVYPIERYFVQGYEPEQSDMNAKTKFTFKNNHTYEVHAKVHGKIVELEIYEDGKYYSKKVAEVNYKFEKDRPEKQYPFSIETTGNVEVIVEEIEVWKLKE